MKRTPTLLVTQLSLSSCSLFFLIDRDRFQEDHRSTCTDGVDNDNDDLIDIEEPDCAEFFSSCGDNTIDPSEACDDGVNNSDTLPDACRLDCALARCGDNVVDTGEVCDDGNTSDADECSGDCLILLGDDDFDGFTESGGDCNDANPQINPAAFEVPGDTIDNNCNGQIDEPAAICDSATLDPLQPVSFARSMGLCGAEVLGAQFIGPSAPAARAIVSSFGNSTPHEGSAMAYLCTGNADTNAHDQGTDFVSTFASPIAGLTRGCGTPSAASAFDYTELNLQIKVPSNANSFSLQLQFFSAEYSTFSCTTFGDAFAALLTSTAFTGNLALEPSGDGLSVNSSFFLACQDSANQDCIVDPSDVLPGTGYGIPNLSTGGGATLPLWISGPVTPNEVITLQLIIQDEGDGLLDSSVLLDAFSWSTQSVSPSMAPLCGDGNIDPDEECDDGNQTNGDGCDNNCTLTACGNFIANGEQCDDGNQTNGDGCSSLCISEFCGDGVDNNVNEQCDDGNQTNGDGCDNNCTTTACGNGIATAGEQCDDGNASDNDSCVGVCQNATCGDGFAFTIGGTEQCDDGNQINTDVCTNQCQSAACGDGFVQAGEQCDDANAIDTDACKSDCTNNICGDGALNPGAEACDDGNNADGDGCDNNCTLTACGNFIITAPETCDDGNTIAGDGCDASCQTE